jgi:hypothetical protein
MIRDQTGWFSGSLFGLVGSSLIAALLIALLAIRDHRPAGDLQPAAKS